MSEYPSHLPRRLGFLRHFVYDNVMGDPERFRRKFCHCLERSPHADQLPNVDYDEIRYSEAEPGSHLDNVWKWFLIRLLVDPDYGCSQVADAPQCVVLFQLAAHILDEMDGAATPTPLPIEVPDEDWLPDADDHSVEMLVDLIVALLQPGREEGEEYKYAVRIPRCASMLWVGRKVEVKQNHPPIGPERTSKAGRAVDRGLTLLMTPIAKMIGRYPVGSQGHYNAQANWLIELMNISWVPQSDREQECLSDLLTGDLTHVREYQRLQRARWVEPEDYEFMPGTFRWLGMLRTLIAEAKAAAAAAKQAKLDSLDSQAKELDAAGVEAIESDAPDS